MDGINFLGQLVQAGALNQANPMEAYANALKMKALQNEVEGAGDEKKLNALKLRGAEYDIEMKKVELGKHYLSTVKDLEDYKNMRGFVADEFQVELPEFDNEEDMQEYQANALMSLDERSKLLRGESVEIYDAETGDSQGSMTQQQINKLPPKLRNSIVTESDLRFVKMKKRMEAEGTAEGKGEEEGKNAPADLRSFEMAHYGKELSETEREAKVKSGQYEKEYKQFQLDTKTSASDIPEEDISRIADAVANGQQSTKNIPKRGKTFAAVTAKVLEQYPRFQFDMNDANVKYRNDSNILRSAGLVNAIMPRINDLYQKAKNLENTFGIPALDKPLNALKKGVGSEKVLDFESLRNAIMFEANTALSGSSVPSDYRIKLELENLESGYTLGQQIKSIENLASALQARKDASTMMAYPIEVVRGEKTLDAWRKEMEQKSKADQEQHSATGGTEQKTISTKAEFDNLPSGSIYIDSRDGKQYRKP